MTELAEPRNIKAHVADLKKEIVKKLVEKLRKAKIIGLVDMEALPGAQLLTIRKSLRGKIEMFMTKKRLMKIAVDQVKTDIPGLDKLFDKVQGMPAFLLTDENPFSLYKTIKKSKSPAPAKAGQLAPYDITLPAGPTPFAPGPVISELAGLGIQAGVVEGKVAIKQDSTVVREGEPISGPLAGMLLRLDIKPMEIGLNVVALLEEGTVYDRKVLDIDEKAFMADLMTAAGSGVNLSVEVTYLTAVTREMIIQKAWRQAKALAIAANVLTSATVGEVLAKAVAQANALDSEAKIDEKMAELAKETPAEEKNEEGKATPEGAQKEDAKSEEPKTEENEAKPETKEAAAPERKEAASEEKKE